MRVLKLEHKGKYYNNVYESIIRKTYKCMEILYTKKVFKLSENAFTELCLSDRRKLLTFEDMIGKSGDIYSDGKAVSSSYKGINDYLAERFTINGKINYELMFANIINIIEENDDLHNTIIQFFCKLRIFENYKDFFYIFSLIQIIDVDFHSRKTVDLMDDNLIMNLFMLRLREFCNHIENADIELILFDDLKKFFLSYFDIFIAYDYILINKFNHNWFNNSIKDDFIYFIEHIDTYKMLDNERKNKIVNLSKHGIYYKEYAEYLSKNGDNKYLSEMMYKLINNECVVV